MVDSQVEILDTLEENPPLEDGGDSVNEALEVTPQDEVEKRNVGEEDFVEGVVEDGFGLWREYEDDDLDLAIPVKRYTFTNKNGMTAQLINYGVTITSVRVPDRKGVYEDVVLGFDTFDEYVENKGCYFGSTIGRVSNRVSNGRFILDNRVYDLTQNLAHHHLHGGYRGFSFVVWNSRIQGKHVIFSRLSPNREEGYPGNLVVQVEVWLTDDNGLKMVSTATSDAPTPINMTNHVYFNLAGHASGPEALGEHIIVVNADKYLEAEDSYLIQTGEIKHVAKTAFLDLRIPRLLSRLIPIIPLGGYDHTYCINGGKDDGVRFVARLIHPKTGRVMEVFSEQPCMVIYTARNLPTEDQCEEMPPDSDDKGDEENPDALSSESFEGERESQQRKKKMRKKEVIGKGGAQYLQYGSICLEPEAYPDAPNKPHFPQINLYPGQTYKHTMVFKFSTLVRTKSIKIEAENNGPKIPSPRHSQDLHRSLQIGTRASGDSRDSRRSDLSSRNSGDVPTINRSNDSQVGRQPGPGYQYEDEEDEFT